MTPYQAELIFARIDHDRIDFTYTSTYIDTATAYRNGVSVGVITCTRDGSNNTTKYVLTGAKYTS